jgi:hypothetical protein
VGPFGLCDGAFNNYMVYFSVVISALPFGLKVYVGASSNCEDCAVAGEGISLLRGLLNLRRRWWWVSFSFDLGVGVIWHWVCDLWDCW